jgi:hypothetical protein
VLVEHVVFHRAEKWWPENVNTIGRAELAAIKVAVEVGIENSVSEAGGQQGPVVVNIATDSLASIYQVKRATTCPQDMREHRHIALINSILQSITNDSTCTVHLWKVKSHIGIVGNEIADETAVAVAGGDITEKEPGETEFETCAQPSNDRKNMYWLYTAEGTDPQSSGPADGGPPTGQPQPREGQGPPAPAVIFVPEPNMAEALKTRIHALRKLGQSNQQSVYFSSWESMDSDIDHRYSHLFMTSTKVNSHLRKLVLQYRYGLLPTFKLLKRYKKAESSTCPLCKEEDSGHHAVSGCRKLSKQTTLRHNNAGTAIGEAIYAGAKGHQIVAEDVGLNKRRREQGVPTMAARRRGNGGT